jgi:Protein of unknown function (DUF4232)
LAAAGDKNEVGVLRKVVMKSLRLLTSAGLLTSALVVSSGAIGSVASATTVKNCAASHLKVSVGRAQGTAGTFYYPVVFTNEGPTCAIFGVPVVQPVIGGSTHSTTPVGLAARNLSMGQMPALHVVTKGHSVSAAIGVVDTGNYSSSTCRPKTARAIVVNLGTFVSHHYLPLTISVCTKISSVTTRLVSAGTTGA